MKLCSASFLGSPLVKQPMYNGLEVMESPTLMNRFACRCALRRMALSLATTPGVRGEWTNPDGYRIEALGLAGCSEWLVRSAAVGRCLASGSSEACAAGGEAGFSRVTFEVPELGIDRSQSAKPATRARRTCWRRW